MNGLENIHIKVYQYNNTGSLISAVMYEQDASTLQLLSRTHENIINVSVSDKYNRICENDRIKLNSSPVRGQDIMSNILMFKVDDTYNMPKITLDVETLDRKPLVGYGRKNNCLNVPTMIRCQNCETNFPTKYQYQRHQCEFNAEKVVLKPDADIKDIERGMRVKFDCPTCGKQFVSKNNLERHQASHENTKNNVCEHCNKQFVSENRLRIHKENHCKKAGDISKFYRSDVAVWKCIKCHEVFSSAVTATIHVESCQEFIELPVFAIKNENGPAGGGASSVFESSNNKSTKVGEIIKNVEKIMTEVLLQCEFCNRTYSDKTLLLLHQRKHTTDRNYICVNCNEYFDSYIIAAQHWLKKCSDRANLFYLPKLTYCEYCDRTFKSHEILYTHKIKKKHYTPKIHCSTDGEQSDRYVRGNDCGVKSTQHVDSKDVIDKLIQDVLITLDVPVNKINNNYKVAECSAIKNSLENYSKIVNVKTEASSSSNNSQNEHQFVLEPEKKKRGRKRKWPKYSNGKIKKISAAVEDGYKYQCERCNKVWDTISDLEAHRETEHAASFSCEECGQILHSAKALLIHSRAHKSLKPYVCDTCGRSYSQTSHLWQHMRFHQGIKPFACPHEGCEARYTIRPDLKDHIRKVHTRERPFKCAVCSKCFLTGSVYYQHRLIHTNDRRYGCDVCCKRFFRADALNNHKRIHTDERPYPCSICGREFRQKGDRNKHVRTQHPDAILKINPAAL